VEWVAIAEYADEQGVVRGQVFSDCMIVGPAALVLVADSNRLGDCDFMRPASHAASAGAALLAPTLHVVDCAFIRCRFDSSVSLRRQPGVDPT
jgi:hypothetical protein